MESSIKHSNSPTISGRYQLSFLAALFQVGVKGTFMMTVHIEIGPILRKGRVIHLAAAQLAEAFHHFQSGSSTMAVDTNSLTTFGYQ